MKRYCPDCQRPTGDNKVVCVFEQPTWREYLLKRPVSGETGCNLEILFNLLKSVDGCISEDIRNQFDRYKCCIVNARWIKTERGANTECFLQKLSDGDERIKYLLNASLIFCFGNEAAVAINALARTHKRLFSSINIVSVYHLSQTAMMQLHNTDKIFEEYGLSKEWQPLMPLIIVAEYVLSRIEKRDVGEFCEFVEGFRKGKKDAKMRSKSIKSNSRVNLGNFPFNYERHVFRLGDVNVSADKVQIEVSGTIKHGGL